MALIENNVDNYLNLLEGMFAFAVFDNLNETLTLTRDRFGKKPLFWSETNYGIVFSSEIKALKYVNYLKTTPNWNVLSSFFTYGYCPGENSSFNEIKHVSPGSCLIINHKINMKYWWNLPSKKESNKSYPVNVEQNILSLLRKAVHKRMVSDVPIGLFLSGGLDSTIILSLIKEKGIPKDFKTYTVGFESNSYDESKQAKYVSEILGVKNRLIKFNPKDFLKMFDDVIYKSDNLISNPAIFANYLLSQEASKDIKVALNGGGGDELFLGIKLIRLILLQTF